MCLLVKKVSRKPARCVAWKVVEGDRRPMFYPLPRDATYRKGKVYKADPKQIRMEMQMNGGEVHYGLHVYTSLAWAKGKKLPGTKIIKVRVSPKHWIADGHFGQAVYSQFKVET